MVSEAKRILQTSVRTRFWKGFIARVRYQGTLMICFIVISLFGTLYLHQNSRDSNLRYEMDALYKERQELRREVNRLRFELATAASLPVVEERARRLGLSEATEFEILAVPHSPDDDSIAQHNTETASLPRSGEAAFQGLRTWRSNIMTEFEAWLHQSRVSSKRERPYGTEP